MRKIIILSIVLLSFGPLDSSAQEIMDRQLAIKTIKQTDLGLRYLRSQQHADGSWSGSLPVTALALRAFLQSYRGYNESDGPFISRPVQLLLKHVKADGSISQAGHDAVTSTSLAIMALKATKNPDHNTIIAAAQDFLIRSQFDDGEGYSRDHPDYGGVGTKIQKPNLILQGLVLEALHETQLPLNDPFWQRSQVFVSRFQNLKPTNDQAWSGNDGGFTDRSGHDSSADMTYLGSFSLLISGVNKNDSRLHAAWSWMSKNHEIDKIGIGKKPGTIFDGNHAFAKWMRNYGAISLTDSNEQQHNWRNELATKLLNRYQPDGSWSNEANTGTVDEYRTLTTAWSINTLNYIIHSLR